MTTPARTLLDLAASLRPRALEDAIERMERSRSSTSSPSAGCLDAHPRQSGAPNAAGGPRPSCGAGVADTRSPLEVALLQLCDDHSLPTPTANTVVAGFLVDFHWPGTDLIVETDGFAFHRMRIGVRADRDRDQVLTLAGYRVVRFTYTQVTRRRRRHRPSPPATSLESGSLRRCMLAASQRPGSVSARR